MTEATDQEDCPRVEPTADGCAVVGENGLRLLLRGAHGQTVWLWWEHMLTAHGRLDARIYLSGLMHGLRFATARVNHEGEVWFG